MEDIKVSVIIPVYNTEEYVSETIKSICNQSLRDIEIICINDGSTDNSLSILESFAVEDKRIRVFSQENGGLSRTRNRGIELARGEFVYFMDSDDILDTEALEKLYNCAGENKLDVIFFEATAFTDNDNFGETGSGEIDKYSSYYRYHGSYEGVYDGRELFIKTTGAGDRKASACLQMVRRELLTEGGISFYPGIYHEDELFTYDIYMNGKRCMIMKQPFFHRRLRSDSIVSDGKYARHMEGYLICMTQLLDRDYYNNMTEELGFAVDKFMFSISQALKRNFDRLTPAERTEYDKTLSFRDRYIMNSMVNRVKQSADYAELTRAREKFEKIRNNPLYKFLKKVRNVLKKIKNKIIR